jgi:hypothetical protein
MRTLILLLLLGSPVQAASTCYLYDGDDYWKCLREERADKQALEEALEELREHIEEED